MKNDELQTTYKDGKQINFICDMFELTDTQRNQLTRYVSVHTRKGMQDEPLKMNINKKQQQDILNNHKSIMQVLMNSFEIGNLDELTDFLVRKNLVFFSAHALERVKQRSSSEDHPFDVLSLLKNVTINDDKNEAVRVFACANQVESRVVWRDSPYCTINFSMNDNRIVVSVEMRIPKESNKAPFFVVTVMNKDHKRL